MSDRARPALIAAIVSAAIIATYGLRYQIMGQVFRAAFATGLMHNPSQCVVP